MVTIKEMDMSESNVRSVPVLAASMDGVKTLSPSVWYSNMFVTSSLVNDVRFMPIRAGLGRAKNVRGP